MVTYEVVEV